MSIIPKNNLVGYWPLDGHALDLNPSTTRNNGTVTGALVVPSQNPAIPASLAYKFDGSGDKITLSSMPLTGATDFSFGCWFKTGTTARQGIITWSGAGTRNGLILYVYTDYKLHFDMPAAGGPNSINRVDDNRWHHAVITGTTANNTVYMYLDGKFQNSTTLAGSWNLSTTGDIYFGAEQSNAHWFNGLIQEGFAFNKALSAQEIQAIYNQSKTKYYRKNWLANVLGTIVAVLVTEATLSQNAYVIKAGAKIQAVVVSSLGNIISPSVKAKAKALVSVISTTGNIISPTVRVKGWISKAKNTIDNWTEKTKGTSNWINKNRN